MMHAYADDSATAMHAIYAAVVLPDRLCSLAVSHLADFKRALNVPVEAELHCHVLFHTFKRDRSEWRHVHPDAAECELRVLCRSLRQISAEPVAAVMPFAGPTAPRLGPDHPVVSEVKGVATFGYMALHQLLIDKFGVDGVRLWLDVDTTRIRWGQQGHRQAHLTREFFAALTGIGTPAIAHPDREPPPYPDLLEVADLYAYALAKREAGLRAPFFAEVCDIVGLRLSRAVFNAEPKWETVESTPEIGQVVWRLHRGGESAVCFFEPFGEGFVWVEVQSANGPVTRDQRICGHPRAVAATLQEFRDKYVDVGWIETG